MTAKYKQLHDAKTAELLELFKANGVKSVPPVNNQDNRTFYDWKGVTCETRTGRVNTVSFWINSYSHTPFQVATHLGL